MTSIWHTCGTVMEQFWITVLTATLLISLTYAGEDEPLRVRVDKAYTRVQEIAEEKEGIIVFPYVAWDISYTSGVAEISSRGTGFCIKLDALLFSTFSDTEIVFVIAHEFGHAVLHFPGDSSLTPSYREAEADYFGYRVLRKLGMELDVPSFLKRLFCNDYNRFNEFKGMKEENKACLFLKKRNP